MYKLSDLIDCVDRDGIFQQTQFPNTAQQNSICFVAAEKYLPQVNGNPAISCVVTSESLAESIDRIKGLVISSHPEIDFYELHNRLVKDFNMKPPLEPFVDPSAEIHPTAHVDEMVYIGSAVEIGPGAVVLNGSILHQGVFVGPNAVIGADGHFYKRYNGHVFRVNHAGGVIVKNNAQILAGSVVSKALHTDFTVVGEESVVSVKAHIGHGCKIGDRCIIAGNAQVSGYTEVANDVWIGPSATVGNLLKIGEGVSIETGSVVISSVDEQQRVSGNFALDHRVNMMSYVRKQRGRHGR